LHEFVARGFGPVEILVNERWEETNMVQSLLAARRHLEVEPCLVSYGDIFYAPETVQALAACDEDLAVASDRDGRALWEERFDDPLADIESFRLAPDGSLAQIGGAVRDIGAVEGQYMGLLKIQPEGFAAFLATLETLPEARRQRVDMTSILTTMIGLGHRIGCVENGAPWGELDSPEDIAFFEKRGGWPAAQHAKVS
jgi:choline kinase